MYMYISYLFYELTFQILNFCMIEKDKYYILFNMQKFKEYIMYVIV